VTHDRQLFILALGVWFAVSLIASWLLPTALLAGLAVAVGGGMVFGVVAARRTDPRKVRVRRRRGSRSQEPV
jgi:hypothetical protein